MPSCLVSAVTTFHLIKEGCQAYLAHVVDSDKTVMKVNDIPVVCEFPDVFPDDLLGLPRGTHNYPTVPYGPTGVTGTEIAVTGVIR